MKNHQKVSKWHFGGSLVVQKSADSRKTGKNHEKASQKLIKKWPKRAKKGSKVCRKMTFWGSKKHGPGGQKASKSALFGHREGQKWQKRSKTDKSWKPCQKRTANWHGKIKSQGFQQIWQFWRKSIKVTNPKSSKSVKMTFLRVPHGLKISRQSQNRQKSWKSISKTDQKVVKKRSKVQSKTAFWGSKKHGPGCQKASKSALFGHREGQKWQNPKNPKSRIKK